MKSIFMTLMLAMLTVTSSLFAADSIQDQAVSEQGLVDATIAGESRKLALVLVLDGKRDIKKFKITEYMKGRMMTEDEYGVEGAQTGIVLLNQKGRDVVKLVSDNFTSYQGGNVKLDYLVNGITGTRANVDIDLARDGDEWSMYVESKKVKTLHFIKNRKRFIGVIGVKRVEFK